MDELRRRFTIDDKLGRFDKALKSLYEMGLDNFDEARSYTAQKELYTEALGLYAYAHAQRDLVMRDYADFLLAMSRFREAGLAYEFLDQPDLAIEAYTSAQLWREALFVAATALSADAARALASDLAETLTDAKAHTDAAAIHLEHLGDTAAGALSLCKAAAYADAMRACAVARRPELLADVVDPALTEAFADTSAMLAECRGQLAAQTARVAELRTRAAADPLAYLDGAAEEDAPDNVSLAPTHASTSASLFTRYTGNTLGTAATGETRRTSKNRRKDDRKRARGKKGSVYEEEYLMNSIRRLAERVDSIRSETEALVEALFRRRMRDSAAALQALLRDLLVQLDGCVTVVFGAVVPEEVPARTEEERMDGQRPVVQPPPVIKLLDGLSLL